ncbi:BapA/Bap/LapF family prefix-like domain-containing protein [Yoonia sp. MH D7]
MSAIEFVVRGDTGVIERGSVAGAGSSSIIVGAGQDISLNLSRNQVVSYIRQGQALQVTLADGQTITIEGYFSPDGVAVNELFISSNGELSKVDLVSGEGNLLFAQYVDADAFGKWSPNDELYFMRGNELQVAGVEAADGEVGMLFAPLLGGLGGLGPVAGLGAAAVVGGATLVAGGKDGGGTDPVDPTPVDPTPVDPTPVDPTPLDPTPVDPTLVPPVVNITTGTQSAGHVVNKADYTDGIDIGGTGTPGATGVITVRGVSQNVVVDGQGSWNAHFENGELPDGDYVSDVSITVTNAGLTATAVDKLDVDTVVDVTINANIVETDGTVSFAEESDGVTITGTTDVNTTVVVTIDGIDYDAVVTDSSWSLNLDAGVIKQGEYDLKITATATDQYGNTGSSAEVVHIDTVTSVTLDTSATGGDGTINRVEHAGGAAVNGTAEANATVVVSFGSYATQTVTADSSGNWSYTFPTSDVPKGTLDVEVTAVSTDAVGNKAIATGTVHIDTDLDVFIDTSKVETDGTVNILEHSDGVVLSGTADAGATLNVQFGTGTRTITSDANGNWSANWNSTEVPHGELHAPVTVTARDNAGNVSTTSATVKIDTLIDVTVDTSKVGGADNVVNGTEHPSGVILTGYAPGANLVTVTLGGVSHGPITVNGDGSWSTLYTAAEVTTGEEVVVVSVVATDTAGNRDTASGSITIDTYVNRLASSTSKVEHDDIVNKAEASDGIVLNGVVETGSRVYVTLEGTKREATVDEKGNWSVKFEAGDIPVMEAQTVVDIVAVDAAGNTAKISDTFFIDTKAPDAADIISVNDAGSVTRGFTMVNVETGDTVDVSQFVNGASAVQDVNGSSGINSLSGELEHLFAKGQEVSDGSHLIVTNADTAGNTNSTLLVLDEDGTSVVDLSAGALNGFNIGVIDLDFAADSELTLSIADLEGLSDNDNTLIVRGGIDDSVTLNGKATLKTDPADPREIDGEYYDVYSIGDNGGELILEQGINFHSSVI